LEFDQKLSSTIEKLKDLSEKQEDLSKKTESKSSNPEALKQQQEQLKKEFDEVKKDLNELEKKNEDLEQKNNFQNPEKEQEQIEQQQNESSKNLDKQDKKKAAENQKNAAEQMDKLAEKMQDMQEESEMQEMQVNMQNLREILSNLLTSSFDQEKVMQSLRTTSLNDPNYVRLTQKQKEVKDNLKMVQDSLYSLSRQVPQIESVINKEIQTINTNIDLALQHLAERKTFDANRSQQYAMTSINNLALMLSEVESDIKKAMKSAKQGKGKGKFIRT
jgi:chromosome segregation ATPase